MTTASSSTLGVINSSSSMADRLGVVKADWRSAMTGGAETKTLPSVDLEVLAKDEDAKLDKKASRKAKASVPAKKVAAEPKTPVAEAKKPTITKKPMDHLENGLTYSLLSRVRNAFTEADRKTVEAGKPALTLIDGRGTEQTISSAYVEIALGLEADGKKGAELLKTIRTSHVRKMLKAKV